MKTKYTPYTYLVGWSNLNKFYYGVRFAQNCNPSDFWVKYFTSSKVVREYRKQYGEPDVLQIRKIFDNKHSAILWEVKVLTRLHVLKSAKWLNLNIAGAWACSNEPKNELAKLKISKGVSAYINSLTPDLQSERSRNRVKKLWEKYNSNEEFRAHISKLRSEQINPMQGKHQRRVSCLCCKKEYPINIFTRHVKPTTSVTE